MNNYPEANESENGMMRGVSMAYAFLFAETEERKVLVDKWGYKWKQETCTGYRREHDNFFLPNMEMYDHQKHSVEAGIKFRRAMVSLN
jgi:hypothetical protein